MFQLTVCFPNFNIMLLETYLCAALVTCISRHRLDDENVTVTTVVPRSCRTGTAPSGIRLECCHLDHRQELGVSWFTPRPNSSDPFHIGPNLCFVLNKHFYNFFFSFCNMLKRELLLRSRLQGLKNEANIQVFPSTRSPCSTITCELVEARSTLQINFCFII